MDDFAATGRVMFDTDTFNRYKKGFLSYSANDEQVLALINEVYEDEGYVLDPHGAVSLVAADNLKTELGNSKLICFATAHPAKFPMVINQALNTDTLPETARHHSIEKAKTLSQKVHLCDHTKLEKALIQAMESNRDLIKNSNI